MHRTVVTGSLGWFVLSCINALIPGLWADTSLCIKLCVVLSCINAMIPRRLWACLIMHKTGNYQQMGCIAVLPILSEHNGFIGIAGSIGLEYITNNDIVTGI
jgi:hypothetical protein